MPGMGTFEGHDALRRPTRMEPRRPQRHLVVNTSSRLDDHEAAASSDVVLIVEGKAGWAIQFVARYRDTLHHVDGRGGSAAGRSPDASRT